MYTGHKRSRAVKRRKERDTRRILRSLMGENEFSARFADVAIQQAGLSDKCVADIGQYLKDQAKSRTWVVCMKNTGTPRYKLIDSGLEPLELQKFEERVVSDKKESTVADRLSNIEPPQETVNTANFSKLASNLTLFIESFGAVLGSESSISMSYTRDVLMRCCGFEGVRATILGRIITSLCKSSAYRPALLKYADKDDEGMPTVTLSAVGRNVAKGTWALRDTSRGVRVYNFASGCYIDGTKPGVARLSSTPQADPNVIPFNPPRVSTVLPEEGPPQPPQSEILGAEVQQPSGESLPGSRAAGSSTDTPVQEAPEVTAPPAYPLQAVSQCNDFYTQRTAQKLWDVLVLECHPADYDKVVKALFVKLSQVRM